MDLSRMKDLTQEVTRRKNALAAITIQSFVRSWACQRELRRIVQAKQKSMAIAIVKTQAWVRSWRCRREISIASTHATSIQRCYRKYRTIRTSAGDMMLSHVSYLRRSHDVAAATVIQAWVRSLMSRKEQSMIIMAREYKLAETANAAIIIQSMVRSWRCRMDLSRIDRKSVV